MVENEIISKHALISSNVNTKGSLPSRVGTIFVVEDLKAEQVTENKSKSKKYGNRILKPSFKPFSQLLLSIIGYLLIVLIACVVWSIPVSVIPMTNTIIHPWYWWEIILNGAFVVNSLSVTGVTITEMKIIFDFKFSRLIKPFVWSFALQFLSTTTAWCLCYLVWTVWLRNNHPMPFVAYFLYVCWLLTHYASIWFMFPIEMRINKRERGKILAYIYNRLWFFFVTLQKIGISVILGKLKQSQWIMSIVYPLYREINLWVLRKIWKKMDSSGDDTFIFFNLTATVVMNLLHAIYVAITISTKASQLTAICILVVDVLINWYETYTIIKRCVRISSSNASIEESNRLKMDVLKLIGIEMVEFLTPIAYTLTFAMAFYGANADLIGGVKFSGWHYKEVKDIGAFLTELGMMFFVDFACAIVSGILFWKFASINMLEEGYKLLKMYWPVISFRLAGSILRVTFTHLH